jgi:general secretion pathway protein G
MKFFSITEFDSRSKDGRRRPARKLLISGGFSLLEMMIVITIILILVGMAAARYEKSVLRAKEATLKQDLFIMRNGIQQYTLDKEAGPTSLDDLVQAKYLDKVPTDPITGTKNWHTESEQVLLDPQQTSAGITDVHSSSDQVSPFEGTPYNTW